MTDRELLELAAKAAGIPLGELDDRWDRWEAEPVQIHRGWNPLTDDGDAHRLAVKLKITLDFSGTANYSPAHVTAVYYLGTGWAANQYWVNQEYMPEEMFVSDFVPDRSHAINQLEQVHIRGIEAATRRAIVRAAAEIGKTIDVL